MDTFAKHYIDVTGQDTEKCVKYALAQNGIITFDGVTSPEDLLSFCTSLGTIVKHRDAEEVSGLTRIMNRSIPSKDGYLAFTNEHLALHTDGSGVQDPASLVLLWCAQPSTEGGMSVFVDGKQLYQILSQDYPEVLEALVTADSAIFGDGSNPIRGSIFSIAGNTIAIRFRYDRLGYYNSPVCSFLPTFLDLLNQNKISCTLQRHQGYLIQNSRWLHGRTSFYGEREMYRALIKTDITTQFGQSIHSGFNPE